MNIIDYSILFIKKFKKPYIGKINYDKVDNYNNDYNFYYRLLTNDIILIENKKKLLLNENKNKKIIYIPYIDYNKYIYSKIEYNYNIAKFIFNYPCNKIKYINIYGNLVFNITLPSLKYLYCYDIIFNEIQPSLKKITIYNYRITSNIINNLNNLLIKCPNLKKIRINKNKNETIMMYHKINNEWNFYYSSYFHINKIIQNLNNDKLNAFINVRKITFQNLNYLTINFNNKKNFSNKIPRLSKNIFIDNVKNIINNTCYDIFIYNINTVNSIQINKSIFNFTIRNLNYKILTFYIDCFNFINNVVLLKNNFESIIKNKLININDEKIIYQLVKLMTNPLLEEIVKKKFYFYKVNDNIKFIKLVNNVVNNLCYSKKNKILNPYLLRTQFHLTELFKDFYFTEDNNYFYFIKNNHS